MSKISMISIAVFAVIVMGGGCEETNIPVGSDTSLQNPVVSQKVSLVETVDPKKQVAIVDTHVVDIKTENVDKDTSDWKEPPEDVDVMGNIAWKQGNDPYLGLVISYPPFYNFTAANFTASDDNGPRWMTLSRQLNDGVILRIEVWKLSDMPERPFGITEPGVDPEVVLPKYQEIVRHGETYGVYMFLNGKDAFKPEMQAIVDTIK